MAHPRDADFPGLLRLLIEANVEHIVVGGVAAILHGASMHTHDVDVVHRRTPENVERLLAALASVDAYVREPGDRRLRPDAYLLMHGRQPLFSTSLGPLDTLCVLNDGRGYDELLPHSLELERDEHRLRVLDLDTLIEVKAAANRPKDQMALPILLKLRERQR